MDKYRIENVVCYPFRTAILVDNGTIEGQIGEGCQGRIVQGCWRVDDGEEEAAKEKADDDYVDEQDRDLDF